MFLEQAACRLEDDGLRRMEPRKVCGAPGGLIQTDSQHCIGLIEKLARFFEEGGGLWFHKSTPSARISCMSGMRGSL
jgi:hypothetical protein